MKMWKMKILEMVEKKKKVLKDKSFGVEGEDPFISTEQEDPTCSAPEPA